MARVRAMLLPAAMLVLMPAITLTRSPAYGSYAYPPAGVDATLPEFMNRVGQVLAAIDNPARRSDMAASWLEFAKTTINRNLEFQQEWLDLQRQQLAQNQEANQQQVQLAQLQLQVERLRAQNLQLEKENLQMQMELKPPNAGKKSSETAAREPNQPAK